MTSSIRIKGKIPTALEGASAVLIEQSAVLLGKHLIIPPKSKFKENSEAGIGLNDLACFVIKPF